MLWRSLRTRVQAVVVAMALAAITATGWQASTAATTALRQATYDRLTAARETRRLALERYVEDLRAHVSALSTSETALIALEDFAEAWRRVPAASSAEADAALRRAYLDQLAARLAGTITPEVLLTQWFPADPRVRALQYDVLARNPHPPTARDLLVEVGGVSAPWGAVHQRHHPTFHRYLEAFGFYDLFLLGGEDGRVLYTVMKEVDLGVSLTAAPWRTTGLGRAYAAAMAQADGETVVIEDYAPYLPSGLAPAAFLAAPIRRAGLPAGVLAIQLSTAEVDRVMTGGRNWREGGLGDTGQAYVVAGDGTLRSDLRGFIEDPDRFRIALGAAGVPAPVVDAITRNGTTVLTVPVDLRPTDTTGYAGLDLGRSVTGARVLRSRAPLGTPGLPWTVVAELDAEEAFAPVVALERQLLAVGAGLALLFLLVASSLGASITTPIRELARAVARLGAGDRDATVPVRGHDEVAELAAAFNRMSADLARTTVSKAELEVLAGRLITAQEDERRRVGRELHDDLVQRVAALAIEAGRIETLPAETRGADLAALRRALGALAEDVHRLSRRIHPAMLEERGLVGSLEAECRAFLERGGPPVDLRVPPGFPDPPPDIALALYRVAQESLRNIAQHARASEVTLRLGHGQGQVSMELSDDGAGFDRHAEGWHAGLGLASMEERVRLLGGQWQLDSRPGAGTRIHITLPVPT